MSSPLSGVHVGMLGTWGMEATCCHSNPKHPHPCPAGPCPWFSISLRETSLPCIRHTRHVRSRKKDADWHARQWGLMNRLSLALVKQTEMFFRVRDPLFLVICLLQYRTFIYPACWGNGSFWFWNILFNREFTSPSFVLDSSESWPFTQPPPWDLPLRRHTVHNSSDVSLIGQ